jgi:hypothetical protein
MQPSVETHLAAPAHARTAARVASLGYDEVLRPPARRFMC